MKNLLYIIALE